MISGVHGRGLADFHWHRTRCFSRTAAGRARAEAAALRERERTAHGRRRRGAGDDHRPTFGQILRQIAFFLLALAAQPAALITVASGAPAAVDLRLCEAFPHAGGQPRALIAADVGGSHDQLVAVHAGKIARITVTIAVQPVAAQAVVIAAQAVARHAVPAQAVKTVHVRPAHKDVVHHRAVVADVRDVHRPVDVRHVVVAVQHKGPQRRAAGEQMMRHKVVPARADVIVAVRPDAEADAHRPRRLRWQRCPANELVALTPRHP